MNLKQEAKHPPSRVLTHAEFWSRMDAADRDFLTTLNEVFGPCVLEAAWTESE